MHSIDNVNESPIEAAVSGGGQVVCACLGLLVIDPLLDRGMRTGLRSFRDAGRHEVQVDGSAARQECLVVEDRHALEPALEEHPARLVSACLSVGCEADGNDSRLPIPFKRPHE
jgi:hypothetical protein